MCSSRICNAISAWRNMNKMIHSSSIAYHVLTFRRQYTSHVPNISWEIQKAKKKNNKMVVNKIRANIFLYTSLLTGK